MTVSLKVFLLQRGYFGNLDRPRQSRAKVAVENPSALWDSIGEHCSAHETQALAVGGEAVDVQEAQVVTSFHVNQP